LTLKELQVKYFGLNDLAYRLSRNGGGMGGRPLLGAARSVDALILVHIFAWGEMGVCDGGHWADVMIA